MTVTLQNIRAKQAEYREVIKAYRVKLAEVISLRDQFRKAQDELQSLVPATRVATHDLRQLGAEYALQIEDDFTPKIPGTEQPGDFPPTHDPLDNWSFDAMHSGGVDGVNLDLSVINDSYVASYHEDQN